MPGPVPLPYGHPGGARQGYHDIQDYAARLDEWPGGSPDEIKLYSI